MVCIKWNQFIHDDKFWEILFKRDYQIISSQMTLSWKERYQWNYFANIQSNENPEHFITLNKLATTSFLMMPLRKQVEWLQNVHITYKNELIEETRRLIVTYGFNKSFTKAKQHKKSPNLTPQENIGSGYRKKRVWGLLPIIEHTSGGSIGVFIADLLQQLKLDKHPAVMKWVKEHFKLLHQMKEVTAIALLLQISMSQADWKLFKCQDSSIPSWSAVQRKWNSLISPVKSKLQSISLGIGVKVSLQIMLTITLTEMMSFLKVKINDKKLDQGSILHIIADLGADGYNLSNKHQRYNKFPRFSIEFAIIGIFLEVKGKKEFIYLPEKIDSPFLGRPLAVILESDSSKISIDTLAELVSEMIEIEKTTFRVVDLTFQLFGHFTADEALKRKIFNLQACGSEFVSIYHELIRYHARDISRFERYLMPQERIIELMKLKGTIRENENALLEEVQKVVQQWKQQYSRLYNHPQVIEFEQFLVSLFTWKLQEKIESISLAQSVSPNQRKWLDFFYAGALGRPYIDLKPQFAPLEKLHLRLNSTRDFRYKAEENEETSCDFHDLITIWKSCKMRLKITGMDGRDSLILLTNKSQWLPRINSHIREDFSVQLKLYEELESYFELKDPTETQMRECRAKAIEYGQFCNSKFLEEKWINYRILMIWAGPGQMQNMRSRPSWHSSSRVEAGIKYRKFNEIHHTSNGGGQGANAQTSNQLFLRMFLLSHWNVRQELVIEKNTQSKHKCKTCGEDGHHANGNCPLRSLKAITGLVESTEESDDDCTESESEEAATTTSRKGIISFFCLEVSTSNKTLLAWFKEQILLRVSRENKVWLEFNNLGKKRKILLGCARGDWWIQRAYATVAILLVPSGRPIVYLEGENSRDINGRVRNGPWIYTKHLFPEEPLLCRVHTQVLQQENWKRLQGSVFFSQREK